MTTPENPKKAYGALKPSASFAPMNVMSGVWRVFMGGARKYGKKNWREQPVEISTYYDAVHRHLDEFFEHGVDKDAESGEHPLDHAIAGLMIIRDGILRGDITDDRKKTEVLTRGEILRKNIEFAGGDVPLTAQPQGQPGAFDAAGVTLVSPTCQYPIEQLRAAAQRAQEDF